MWAINRNWQTIIDQEFVEQTGLPSLILMERAASSLFSFIKSQDISEETTFCVFCGSGSNGGDGYALARLLAAEEYEVEIYEYHSQTLRTGEAKQNRDACIQIGLSLSPISAFDPCAGYFIDAIFGTGYKRDVNRSLDDSFYELSEKIEISREECQARVLAVDLPSGLDADTGIADTYTIRADDTVTFIGPKPGLYLRDGKDYSGRVHVFNIGISSSMLSRTIESRIYSSMEETLSSIPSIPMHPTITEMAPIRKNNSHKGDYGPIGILAGSQQTAGAAILTVKGAQTGGAGVIHSAVPSQLQTAVLSQCPSSIIHPFEMDESPEWVIDFITSKKSVLIGPGSGFSSVVELAIEQAIKVAPRLVLDADALTILSKNPEKYQALLDERYKEGLALPVLTPHIGEGKRLEKQFEEGSYIDSAIKMAKQWKSIIVLKSVATVIAIPFHGDVKVWLNTTGSPSLSKGGSGDVLSGFITGLLAQDMDVEDAVVSAVYIHGFAGNIAYEKKGSLAFAIESLPEYIGYAMQDLGWEECE